MSHPWPLVPLGEVLLRSGEWVDISPTATYRLVTVRMWGKGVVPRGEVTGAQIAAPKMRLVRANEFILSKIDARNGALGLVPQDLDGAVASTDFPTFRVNAKRALPEFIGWLSRTPGLVELCRRASEGTTNRVRLQEDRFLECKIAIPDLADQRRVVDRIDRVSTQVRRLQDLGVSVARDVRSMQLRVFAEIVKDAALASMSEVAPLVRRSVIVDPELTYHEIGIRSFGNGTFHKTPTPGASLGTKRIFRVAAGDLLFNIVFAWEGAVAVATPLDDGWCGSHRFLTCVPNPDIALARYLFFHFLTETGLRQLGEASPGGAGRNRTLGLKALERIRVPIPSLPKQRWFVELLDRFDEASRLQREVSASIQVLLPAVLDRAFRGEL